MPKLAGRSRPDPVLRPHRLGIGCYDRTDDGLVRSDRVELDLVGERTEVPKLVGRSRPDLVLLNDDDLTYAKIRLDEASLATVLGSISEFRDSLPRTLCWTAAWDMTRDAEMAARDFVELVTSGIASETDSSVVRVLLRQVEAALTVYVAPEHRVAARDRFADSIEALMRTAAPRSDSQLQFVRSFAAAATSDAQLAVVRALLDGAEVLEGLEVDTDLRWGLLHQLVAAGKASDADIDAELARDDTAAGRRNAASARAARPTIEAKREAWASVVEHDDLPNALQTAVIGGFSQLGQEELLAQFVGPYFSSLTSIWASRTNETAQSIAVGFYPTLLAGEDLLRQTDVWLESTDAPASLRRLVLESRDGVARALRAQARDAAR